MIYVILIFIKKNELPPISRQNISIFVNALPVIPPQIHAPSIQILLSGINLMGVEHMSSVQDCSVAEPMGFINCTDGRLVSLGGGGLLR